MSDTEKANAADLVDSNEKIRAEIEKLTVETKSLGRPFYRRYEFYAVFIPLIIALVSLFYRDFLSPITNIELSTFENRKSKLELDISQLSAQRESIRKEIEESERSLEKQKKRYYCSLLRTANEGIRMIAFGLSKGEFSPNAAAIISIAESNQYASADKISEYRRYIIDYQQAIWLEAEGDFEDMDQLNQSIYSQELARFITQSIASGNIFRSVGLPDEPGEGLLFSSIVKAAKSAANFSYDEELDRMGTEIFVIDAENRRMDHSLIPVMSAEAQELMRKVRDNRFELDNRNAIEILDALLLAQKANLSAKANWDRFRDDIDARC